MNELALGELLREIEFRNKYDIEISRELREEFLALLPRAEFEYHGTHLVPKRHIRQLLKQSK